MDRTFGPSDVPHDHHSNKRCRVKSPDAGQSSRPREIDQPAANVMNINTADMQAELARRERIFDDLVHGRYDVSDSNSNSSVAEQVERVGDAGERASNFQPSRRSSKPPRITAPPQPIRTIVPQLPMPKQLLYPPLRLPQKRLPLRPFLRLHLLREHAEEPRPHLRRRGRELENHRLLRAVPVQRRRLGLERR